MRYRKLAPGDDYSFGNSELDLYRDVPEAPAQAAKTRLELWTGEWFLDLNEGTPWIQGALGKYQQADADRVIQARVLGTQGVTGIDDYSSEINPTDRLLTVTRLNIDTIYGPNQVDVSNRRNF